MRRRSFVGTCRCRRSSLCRRPPLAHQAFALRTRHLRSSRRVSYDALHDCFQRLGLALSGSLRMRRFMARDLQQITNAAAVPVLISSSSKKHCSSRPRSALQYSHRGADPVLQPRHLPQRRGRTTDCATSAVEWLFETRLSRMVFAPAPRNGGSSEVDREVLLLRHRRRCRALTSSVVIALPPIPQSPLSTS